jgi:hypothetical protein
MIAVTTALLLAAVQPSPDPAEPEQRQLARELFEQLLAEDANIGGQRYPDGRDYILINTRPRASDEGGLCTYDLLFVERAALVPPPQPGGTTIRRFETQRWFFVLTGAGGQPDWEVRGEELERRCAATNGADASWFEADDPLTARATVSALFTLAAELRKPHSGMIEWQCGPGPNCPDRIALAERIRPLSPMMATRRVYERCPEGRLCVQTLLRNPGCGSWSTQLQIDPEHPDRLRFARIGNFVGALACGEMEMDREREADQPAG